MRTQLALCVLAGAASAARQASNFNVTAAQARAASCGDECLEGIRLGTVADVVATGTSFDWDFYATAANMTRSRAGDMLKLEAVQPGRRKGVKAGTSVWRFQYTTVDLDGTLVPATGFIAFPYGAPRRPGGYDVGAGGGADIRGDDTAAGGGADGSNKFRLVAFAHGTLGMYTGCAPSTGPSLFDYDSWQPLVGRGYAVVATDYAGLGNNATQHKYCSFNAHATDVYYSVVAARRVFGHVLTREWMAAGHSQGGGAAWKLAESEYVANDTAYLGTVALAPATHAVDMLQLVLDGGARHSAYLPYLPEAVRRADPSYRETLLSDTVRRRLRLADEAQLCNSALLAMTQDLTGRPDRLVSLPGLARDLPALRRWQAAVAPAQGARGRSPAPVLVLQGLNDTAVLPPTTMAAVESSCREGGNEIHLSLYPGLEHSPLLQAGAPEWLGWIDARFDAAAANRASAPAGRGAKGGKCSWRTREAFHLELVSLPGDESSPQKGGNATPPYM